MTKFLNISTDNTLGGASPSDETVSSQKAIKAYVDNGKTDWYGTCDSYASAENKVVVCPGFDYTHATGAVLRVQFTNSQIYNGGIYLNVNSTGIVPVEYRGSNRAGKYEWAAGEVISFTFTGAAWVITGGSHASTLSYGRTILTDTVDSTDTKSLTPKGAYLALQNKQDTLVSGTNIKTINGSSILGSGDISVGGSVAIDNSSITTNSSSQLQTVGVIDQNNTTNAIKTWTGTKTQYDAITTKDSNTLYNITDDTDVGLTVLQAVYPVGSIYIGTMSTCPLASLFGTWTLVGSSILANISNTLPVKGDGKALGITDGTNLGGLTLYHYDGDTFLSVRNNAYGANVGDTASTFSGWQELKAYGITTDSTKSGLVADVSSLKLNVNIWQRTA